MEKTEMKLENTEMYDEKVIKSMKKVLDFDNTKEDAKEFKNILKILEDGD